LSNALEDGNEPSKVVMARKVIELAKLIRRIKARISVPILGRQWGVLPEPANIAEPLLTVGSLGEMPPFRPPPDRRIQQIAAFQRPGRAVRRIFTLKLAAVREDGEPTVSTHEVGR
jgi:hypothetical protein